MFRTVQFRVGSVVGTLTLGLVGFAGTASAATILVDFGPNDTTNGRNTVSPTNGNTYNNVNNASANTTSAAFLDTTGAATTVTVTPIPGLRSDNVTAVNWGTNGRLNGGLASPTSPPLDADFAVGTLTEDYFFFDAGGPNGTASLRFNGLDPALTYTLDVFATRTASDTRVTRYTVGGKTVDLQTTGTGAGSAANPTGNDDDLARFTNLVPNAAGQITLGVMSQTGNFGYVGGVRLSSVPEPTSAAAAAAGAGLLALRRRRRTA